MAEKKRRGRKPLPPEKGKRVPLNMRTTLETRAALEASAKASGRSLAQEVEFLVEKALADKQSADEIRQMTLDGVYASFGKKDNFTMMKILNLMVLLVEHLTGQSWREDKDTAISVMDAFAAFIQRYGPKNLEAARPKDPLTSAVTRRRADEFIKDFVEIAPQFAASENPFEAFDAIKRESK